MEISSLNICDGSELILSRREKRVLAKIIRYSPVGDDDSITTTEAFKHLRQYELVLPSSDERFGATKTSELNRPILNCYIASPLAIQYLRQSNAKSWKEFRAWATLVIAVLAFLKSFFF